MKKNRIFLDTNFLVASQIPNHPFNADVARLLTKFYLEDFTPSTHALVFDEFWYVLKGIQNTSVNAVKPIKIATNNIFNFKDFVLLKTQLNKNDLLKVLNLMEKYKLRPRDALIVQIMHNERITKLATFDKHFENIKGIEIER